MNNNTTQEKQKSNIIIKILSATLCVVMIASIIFNVYQFNVSNTLRSEIALLQSETETLKTDRDTLNKEVETKQNEESDLTKQIEDLQKKIEKLEADNQSLADSLRTLEDGINSTHTDIILGDDEYKGDTGADALQSEYDSLSEEEQEMVDQIVEDMMKEHPEWFQDTTGNTNEGNYEDVGTPDNTENTRQIEFGESGSEGLADNVTVY